MIDWEAALDSHFGVDCWDENGFVPESERPAHGYNPYSTMAINRTARYPTNNPTRPASAGLPTLGKRR